MLAQGLSFLAKPYFALIHNQFTQALRHPQIAQAQVKTKILKNLTQTAYGSTLKVKTLDDWSQLPIVTYDTLEPWINQQYQYPSKSILTPEKINFWEFTSGSTGPKKSIPYTPSLRNSFSAMYCIWVYDLMCHAHFSSYKSYLCISPQIGDTIQGIDDTAYLNPSLQWLVDQFLIRAPGPFPTVEAFRFGLAIALLQAPDLEVFSLWSPSFLTTQLYFMQGHQEELRRVLHNRISRTRWQLLGEPEIAWNQMWPHLKLISCWDRQYAADQAMVLKQSFPDVLVQGKGLLATEAPMTIPLIEAQGFVPLVNQVVFEFLDDQDQIHDLTQLQLGNVYELVISQLGGLYRYRMGDRVTVSHWYLDTPCLDFRGRGDGVSDLVGEKLTIEFVTQCFNHLGYLQWGLACLVPLSNSPPHYCLLLEASPLTKDRITSELETALQTNFHYRKARQLGQLGPVGVIVDRQVPKWLQDNKRLGDCKYPVLRTQPLELDTALNFKGNILD
jgi:hypothetical protein